MSHAIDDGKGANPITPGLTKSTPSVVGTKEQTGGPIRVRYGRRRGAVIIVLLFIFSVAVGLISPVLLGEGPLWIHVECTMGRLIGSVRVYTPYVPLESPFHGRVDANVTSASFEFRSGGLVVRSSVDYGSGHIGEHDLEFYSQGNGSVTVSSLLNVSWSIYGVSNSTLFGVGPSAPCTTPRVAQASILFSQHPEDVFPYWQNAPATNDSSVPLQMPGWASANFSRVVWGQEAAVLDLRYAQSNSPAVNTCSQSMVSERNPFEVSSGTFGGASVGIPFNDSGQSGLVWGTEDWDSTSSFGPLFSYSFSSHGVWQVDALGGPGVGPYAFDYQPCP